MSAARATSIGELARRARRLGARRAMVIAALVGEGVRGDALSRKTVEELAQLIEAARLKAKVSLEWVAAEEAERRVILLLGTLWEQLSREELWRAAREEGLGELLDRAAQWLRRHRLIPG